MIMSTVCCFGVIINIYNIYIAHRTTVEPLQGLSDKYRPTGSDQQEDLATLGSMQLRQTLAL